MIFLDIKKPKYLIKFQFQNDILKQINKYLYIKIIK